MSEPIVKTKSGKWQVNFSWYDANKQRHFKRRTFRLKSQAQIWLNEMQQAKNNDQLATKQAELPFAEYFWKWFETYKEAGVTERTRRTYLTAYHALQTYMPPIKTIDMDRRSYRKFIAAYGRDHAKSTVSKFNSLYHACVKDALYDGDIKRDFIASIDIVFNRDNTRKIDYLNINEMQRLTQYLMHSLNPHFTGKYMILTALFTGARLGEIQGLQWQNINFTARTITIAHAWNDEESTIQPTKNESSNRVIRVNPELLTILQQLRNSSADTDFVFLNQYGTIPTSSAVNKTLRQAMDECDIQRRGFHFHSLRHTHVAFLLAHNIDIYIIAKRLGHSDISTTTRVYSYLIDEYKAKADQKIEDALREVII